MQEEQRSTKAEELSSPTKEGEEVVVEQTRTHSTDSAHDPGAPASAAEPVVAAPAYAAAKAVQHPH